MRVGYRAHYGLEHRNMTSLTPLMMAASAGSVALVEALLERVRLARNQGEFFVLALMLASFHDAYDRRSGLRPKGFTAAMLDDEKLAAFPRSVAPEERRRRVYWNGVLARGEVAGSYRPARKLWRRERHGSYVPRDVVVLRTTSDDGREQLRSLHDVLRVALLDEHADARAKW